MSRPSGDLGYRHRYGETEIFVGGDALERAAPRLASWTQGRRTFLLTSDAVADRQRRVVERIESLSVEASHLRVPDGEEAKSLAVAQRLWTEMLEAGGRRDSRLIAIGGGSVTDVGGFVAACYLRGVGCALVPTTLLGQVDACLGGKTGVDLPLAKNCVGAFLHPDLIVAPTGALATLAPRQWRAGLVEVVKIALAVDMELFERLERLRAELGEPLPTGERLDELVRRAMRAKIGVVETDPREADRRRVLNLGHTLGHALEAALGYEELLHGEAVAYGLLFALRLGRARGLEEGLAGRVRALLDALRPPPLPPVEMEPLIAAMGRDKKARRDGLHWIVPVGPERVEITAEVSEAELRAELGAFLQDPWRT